MTTLELVQKALEEDLPQGDVTTDSLALESTQARARLIAKEDLVLSGVEPFELTFKQIDRKTQTHWLFKDGNFIWSGQTIATLSGSAASLLRAERVALNFLGQLSGIATLTRCFVEKLEGTSCQILDTRKTTPLLRNLEKMAVRHGRGVNHRMNLSDQVLIKDNHIKAMGGITQAVEKIRSQTDLAIEVECSTLEQVKEAVGLRVQRILLDNMTTDQLRAARTLIPPTIETEASGNMTLDRVREVAEAGVNFISVGAITHSAPCADISLNFEFTGGNRVEGIPT